MLSNPGNLSRQEPTHRQMSAISDTITGMKPGLNRAWPLLSVAILLVGAGWIWLSRTEPDETTSGEIPSPRQGFLAPDFTLQNSTGETIRLSTLHGQPVLINLWASWCAPCRAEMPALERVYKDYQKQGLEVLAVNSTSQDNPIDVAAFVEQNGLTFPILFDTNAEVGELYQVQSLPSSFFIDSTGKIQDVVIGGPMSEALLRVRVEQLIAAGKKEFLP